jgi:tetratricopeptide (TPR) repeat protein
MRLLSKDPAERPTSATDVLSAFEAITVDVSEHRFPEALEGPDASGDAGEGAPRRPAANASMADGARAAGTLDSMASGVFVGRHREMDALKAAFEETLGGHGKMAALVGEPGIGKTRTAQELATYAAMRGGQVLWGRCYEGGGAPPYWPWVQAIRSYVIDRDAEAVRQEMGSTASVIAEIVPDVKERLPDLQPPQTMEDPESARFRLFDAITTFLKTASGTQPIVLMLEDLHWSDKPSLMLLEFVARELNNSRLMIVGNYRDMELNRRHPLSVTLGELTREHLFDRVVLRGLQKHDVHRFIEVAAGIDPPDSLVAVVHSQTEGNPLFVTETVRLLIQEGDITSGTKSQGGTSSWEVRIPEGVREVIGRRLDRLSERCNEVLTIAAVIGRRFRFAVLLNLAEEVSENMLLDVLDEALNARIVEEDISEVGLYQFSHALMQETLTSELSATRLVRLHARIAEALEQHYGADSEAHAEELVEHFAEAEVVLGESPLFRYSLAAGYAALDKYAFEDGLTHFERAVDAIGAADTRARGLAYAGLGRCQMAFVNVHQGYISVLTGMEALIEADDIESALILASQGFPAQPSEEGKRFHELALKITPELSGERAMVLGRLGLLTMFRDSLEEGGHALAKALEISRKLDDQGLTGWTLGRISMHKLLPQDYAEAIEAADGAWDAAEAVGDTALAGHAGYYSNLARWAEGDISGIRESLPRQIHAAQTATNPFRKGQASTAATSFYLQFGEFNTGIELMKSIGSQAIIPIALLFLYGITGHPESQSSFDTAVRQWESLEAEIPDVPYRPGSHGMAIRMVFLSELNNDVNQLDQIDTYSRRVLERARHIPQAVSESKAALAMSAILRGDASAAAKYEPAVLESNQFVYAPLVPTQRLHLLGQIARLKGNLEEAIDLMDQTITFSRNNGLLPELVFTLANVAAVHLDRDATGDHELATQLQDEAITIATELGMKPLLERILSQRKILEA